MKNTELLTKTDGIMGQILDISNHLSERTKRIDFKREHLSEDNITDLKLHLGYTRNYVDLARLKLDYYKVVNSPSLNE